MIFTSKEHSTYPCEVAAMYQRETTVDAKDTLPLLFTPPKFKLSCHIVTYFKYLSKI